MRSLLIVLALFSVTVFPKPQVKEDDEMQLVETEAEDDAANMRWGELKTVEDGENTKLVDQMTPETEVQPANGASANKSTSCRTPEGSTPMTVVLLSISLSLSLSN